MLEVKDPVIKLFGKSISLEANLHLHHHEESSCTTSQDNKSTSGGEPIRNRAEDDPIHQNAEESVEETGSTEGCETPPAQGTDPETLSPKVTKEEKQRETSGSQEKTLKKPDKILRCPRCHSMDTKFCYFNNYNVNQPRHFCKNCHRYWTAGGAMRNVPVGSGRRKNKNSCCFNYQRIMVSDALLDTQRHPEPRIAISHGEKQIGRDHSSADPQEFSVWPFQQDSAYWGSPHSFNHSGSRIPTYPATPYWNRVIANPWNSPWLSLLATSGNQTLRKHSMDEGVEEKDAKRSVLLPNGAARSSICWKVETKNEMKQSISTTSLFKAFQPKISEKNHVADTILILQANPTAFSRSVNFHEST